MMGAWQEQHACQEETHSLLSLSLVLDWCRADVLECNLSILIKYVRQGVTNKKTNTRDR